MFLFFTFEHETNFIPVVLTPRKLFTEDIKIYFTKKDKFTIRSSKLQIYFC